MKSPGRVDDDVEVASELQVLEPVVEDEYIGIKLARIFVSGFPNQYIYIGSMFNQYRFIAKFISVQ